METKTPEHPDICNLKKSGEQSIEVLAVDTNISTRCRPSADAVKMMGTAPVVENFDENNPMYKKSTLENGIRIVTETIPGLRSISIGILIDAGLRNESPDQSGLAHLVEHVMFGGTSSRNAAQISQLMDEAGGRMGAFTTRDYTCYFASVLDDYRTYALDLLGDILLNSIFPPKSLEREKSAILREITTSYDMPDQRSHDLLKAIAWPGHPLGRPIAGRPESLKRLTREDVIYFVHEHYLPDRFIIAAAGNVEHEDFVAQVRDAFWRMMGRSPATVECPPVFQSKVAIEHMPVSQAYFSLGIRACPYAHPDRYALHVLNGVLGGGFSSRLFRRLREHRGLAYHIGSEDHAYRDDGMLVVEGSTAPEYLLQVLRLTIDEMWKLVCAEQPINEEELWKATMQIRGQHLLSGENSNTRMSRLASQGLYFNGHISDEEILSHIESMDIRMLQRLAGETLADSLRQASLAVVGPEAPGHYNKSQIEGLFAADYRNR